MNIYNKILIGITLICIIFILGKKITEHFNECQPIYEPQKWNKKNIKKSHDCYSYSVNQLEYDRAKRCEKNLKNKKSCRLIRRGPPIPKKDIYTLPPGKKVTCDSIMYGVNNDISDLEVINNNSNCPDNKYKVALFIDDKNKSHHFLRQDKCNNPLGIWSHKNASGPVTQLDASNKIIYDPKKANLKYSWVNYNQFCNYLCISDDNHLKPAI